MGEPKEGEGLHLVMVPWLAFGHLIPFHQLSTALAKSGFKISFFSTPKNIQRLPKLPWDLTARIRFIAVPLPHVDGLDPSVESTSDLPSRNDELLKTAFDLLATSFEKFVTDESPDLIVHDILASWTAQIASQYGVPRVLFSVYSACMVAFMGLFGPMSVESLRESLRSPDGPSWLRQLHSAVRLLPHEAERFCNGFVSADASGVSVAERSISAVRGCEAIILRSLPEYEGDYLGVLQEHHPKPVIPVGFFPPEKRMPASVSGEWAGIFRWLDGKPAGSVVYVVFGSERKLSRSEIYEIALGLELSELCFLWALSRPEWAADDSEALPPGFVDRASGSGVVSLGWAPQLDVLAHPAIGGCMFHAGWSSLIETVQFGLGLVFLPFSTLQKLDARVAVEKGLGVEVERDEDGMFHRDGIARSLRRAMVGEEGERLQLRSREMMAVFGNQWLNERYLDGFLDFLASFRSK